jgi:ribosomal protein S12 methylthiotransferase accessory factor
MTDMATGTAAATGTGLIAPKETTPPGPVAVLGSGRLHAAITSALARATPPGSLATPCAAIVVAGDTDDTRSYSAVRRQAARLRVPWLPVRVDAGWVLIGPAVRPGRPGCPTCVAARRDMNRPDALGRAALRAEYGEELDSRPCGLLTPLITRAVAELVAAEVGLLHHDPPAARTAGRLLKMAVPTGVLHGHPVLPDPMCPDCGSRPPDHPAASRPTPGPALKPRPDVFRVGDLAGRAAELEAGFVDAETGFVQSLATETRGGSPMAVARLAPARSVHESHHGFGRCDDFVSARATAIAEALERVSGLHPRARRTVVHAAYADVADRALDPRTLGLYPDDWYDQPDFWFTRFDPERPAAWVWGYSFARDEPLLVPESYAYFGARPSHDLGFAYECSNGCAIGGCAAEAVLYGLLEVAERDAFLTTWYARLPVPKVDLGSAADRRSPLIAERIRHHLGYEVSVFVATMEQGLPVFLVLAVDRSGRRDRPRAFCGTATHLIPERALRRALDELGPILEGHIDRYDEAEVAPLVADPGRVRLLEHHPMLYGHPDAFDRFGFRPMDGPEVTMAEVTAGLAWPAYDDLTDDLAELAGRYLGTGLDVIAVNTTAPEARAAGFTAVKVIVPGTVPMTFGHRYRRLHGLPRLLSRPRLLGFRDTDLSPGDLNPHPHPFA